MTGNRGLMIAMPLLDHRALAGLSLRKLAERCGIHHTTLWRLEHGRAGASPETVRKLGAVLGEAFVERAMRGYRP